MVVTNAKVRIAVIQSVAIPDAAPSVAILSVVIRSATVDSRNEVILIEVQIVGVRSWRFCAGRRGDSVRGSGAFGTR